ncbi:MAG: hypothetical protein GX660_04815 [Clostridiaceae bacterium]|nr:hypothetical protein [Clostridiaceae bacterium]
MKNVRPLERELEIAFIKSDILDNKKLAKKLNELGKDKFKDFLSVDDWYKKASLVNYDMYSEPSVLSYIFNDLLLKSVLPGLWNTQTGPASFLDTILQIATVHRYDFAISRILITNRLSLASSFIKIELGRLRYFTDSSDEIADALEEAFKRAIRENKKIEQSNVFRKQKLNIKDGLGKWEEGIGRIGKAKIITSNITSSLQIVISLYDLFQFVEKYGNEITSETEFKKDFYNLYKSIHSGVTATTGFNLNMVNKYPKLERIFRNGARVLRFGSALAMFIDAYLLYQESEEAKVLGEEFIVGMRTTQAVISGSAGVYLFLTLCTPLPFVPAIAGLVGLTLLVLSIVEWVHEYNLRGTKKVIQQLRDEINRSRFIKGDIIFKSEGKNYAFFAVSYLNAYNNGKFEKAEYSQSLDNLKWTNPYQRYDNVIDKKYIERWNAIANKIGQQNYWNLEIIPAGREMKEKGFTDNTIAFVAMKRSNLTTLEKRKISGEPYRYEVNKIENYPSHAYGAMYPGMGYTGYGYSGFKMVYKLL